MKSIFSLILSLQLWLWWMNSAALETDTFQSANVTDIENEPATSNPKTTCIVVTHDRIRGYLNWAQDWFKKAVSEQCNKRVVLLENKQDMNRANVVIFHAPTHRMNPKLHTLKNKHSSSGAIYAMVSMEQPKYSTVLSSTGYLSKNMDLMVTYSHAALFPGTTVPNLPVTYYPLNILAANAVMQPTRNFQQKDGYGSGVAVALFASNCKNAGASDRSRYIEELMRHIPVHSYGKCYHNIDEPALPLDSSWPSIAQKRARKIKILSRYKFYLAFENAEFDDYVSEKVFEGLVAGAVPVYRGARNIGSFMPSNDSFIDANAMNPAVLSSLLKKLAADEQQYDQYMQFRKRQMSAEFQRMTMRSYAHPNVLCRLCNLVMDA